jgi:hypothetical protein
MTKGRKVVLGGVRKKLVKHYLEKKEAILPKIFEILRKESIKNMPLKGTGFKFFSTCTCVCTVHLYL